MLVGAFGLNAAGCDDSDDVEDNNLGATSADADAGDGEAGDDEAGDDEAGNGGGSLDDGAADGDSGGVEPGGDSFPAAFRFDCIEIRELGSDPDGSSLQANVLQNAWSDDIDGYKLNIVVDLRSQDPDNNAAEVALGSGVGTRDADLCGEPDSQSEVFAIGYDAAVSVYQESLDTCSSVVDASGVSGGTYTMELGTDDVVYVYAEDDDGTAFNCTPDAALPDAVPIRAISAQITVNETGTGMAGVLNGCLTDREAESLCSCLVSCNNAGPDDIQTEGVCAGCPTGGGSLRELLGGITPSDRCTTLMGADAYDIELGFSATRLADSPAVCG